MDEHTRTHVHDIVMGRMASFEAAERALDAEALLSHFSAAGDFSMHNDGQRIGLDAVASNVRSGFPTLRALDGGFSGVEVHVLAADAALVTALFQEAVTMADGTVVRQRGAATWLWRQRDGEWFIVYGHVDHYPGEA
jgi:uncharacterized protein (TIGR02246 family)